MGMQTMQAGARRLVAMGDRAAEAALAGAGDLRSAATDPERVRRLSAERHGEHAAAARLFEAAFPAARLVIVTAATHAVLDPVTGRPALDVDLIAEQARAAGAQAPPEVERCAEVAKHLADGLSVCVPLSAPGDGRGRVYAIGMAPDKRFHPAMVFAHEAGHIADGIARATAGFLADRLPAAGGLGSTSGAIGPSGMRAMASLQGAEAFAEAFASTADWAGVTPEIATRAADQRAMTIGFERAYDLTPRAVDIAMRMEHGEIDPVRRSARAAFKGMAIAVREMIVLGREPWRVVPPEARTEAWDALTKRSSVPVRLRGRLKDPAPGSDGSTLRLETAAGLWTLVAAGEPARTLKEIGSREVVTIIGSWDPERVGALRVRGAEPFLAKGREQAER